ASIPSPTSITDELATVLSNDPGNMRLLSSLTPPCSILSTALSLGSAIAQIAPDLADKPSLHVLVIAPDELLIDGGRWFQLAGDRLGRAHPIRVSVATLERFRFQSSEYADMLTHKSQAEIVDIDTCI